MCGISPGRFVLALIRQARSRLLRNELLSQGANACSAALIAFILLLLVGAQLLSWQWFLLIPIAALGVGLYRTRQRMPSSYRVAQVVDHRLGLADTLSTAFFFSSDSGNRAAQDVRQSQAEKAEAVARSVDVRQAIPYTLPRTIYLAAALVLVASSLFALRYGLSRRLDLKAPLASMVMQQFGWTPKTETAKNTRRTPPVPETQSDDGTASEQDKQGQDQKQDGQQNQDSAENGQESADKNGSAEKDAGKQGDKGDQKNAGDEDAQAEKASDSPNADGDPNKNGQQGSKSEQAQNNPKSDSGSSNDSPSLWSKVKDAAQNLMSRMKPQQGNQNQQQGQNDQANKQQGQGQQNGKQQQSAKNGQQNGEQPGDAQDGQNGEEAKNQQDPQGKGTGKSDSKQASKQPGSGIGSQDGDKTIKQAEQLAAMGKISELFGKRSANITGEATVEVQSTSQTLRTQYVQRGAQHTQGGAEISRDEIPVALQNYVESYIELVRKQAPATTAAPAVKK
jgi:hypothetical protein